MTVLYPSPEVDVLTTDAFCVGDQVELVTVPPGRRIRLRPGLRGVVEATGLEFGWVTCTFRGTGAQAFLLRPSHLRHVVPGE